MLCEAAASRKADEIMIMDMGKISGFCEFFLVVSATSTVRVRAIVDHIHDTLKERGMRILHKEGYQDALWVLLDLGDVVVHVFHEETRKFYSLDALWGDVPVKRYTA
jgi:ribosome-associated protein